MKTENKNQILGVLGDNLRRLLINPRFYISLILVTILMHQIIGPIRIFCSETGISITPWIFPHVVQWYFIQNIILIGVVLLFCDAPFFNEGTPFLIMRSGRGNWIKAQLLYVMAASFICCFSLLLISILLTAPYIDFSLEWGKIINTLAQTDASNQIGTVKLDYKILQLYHPVQATALSFFISWLVVSFTGILMLTANLFGRRIIGAVLGTALSFTPYFAMTFTNLYIGYYVSPPTWMDITLLADTGYSSYPSASYIFSFLVIGIIVLSLISYLRMRKKIILITTDL